jgi:predicted CXXCH cytochrome family protein
MAGCCSPRTHARPFVAHGPAIVLGAALILTLLAPSLALALAAPSGLTVTSGAMADTLRWNRVRSSSTSAYRVERASAPGGPWRIVARRTRATSLLSRVPSARTWYYRVRTIDRRGRVGAASAAMANTTVSISSVVGARGATLRASNGQLTLALPAGTFAGATRVTVREAGVPPMPSSVRVTRAYDFRSTSALRSAASLTIPYRVPISHFQVAGAVARGIDWMCWDVATRNWVAVPTTVDTDAGTLTASMPHFSYWTAAVKIQPHGTTASKIQYCGDGSVCHALASAPGSPVVLANTDTEVCYSCHGNTAPGDPPAGVADGGAQNVEAAFFSYSSQSFDSATMSRHPAAAPGATGGGLKCTLCHDPHADPVRAPYMLRAFDPITKLAIASANATMPGNEYCWACHGSRSNWAANAAVPNYWLKSGGNRRTAFSRTGHVAAVAPDGSRKGCLSCHAGHSASNTALIREKVGATVVTGNDRTLCYACHEPALRLWSGRAVFSSTAHSRSSATTHALTTWPGLTGAPAEPGGCRNCHDVHGTANPDYLRATGDTPCFTCHDDAAVQRAADSTYRGRTAFAASAHSSTHCADCHAVHGKSVDGTTQPHALRSGQVDACFRCHAASGDDTDTPGAKPFTWNGRDLAVEFSRPSKHPVINTAPTMTASPETQTVFSQANQTEFGIGTLTSMTSINPLGVELYYGNVLMADQGPQSMLFYQNATGQQYYDVAANSGAASWNEHAYDPPDLPSGRQLLATTRAGDRLVTLARGATSQEIWEFALPSAISTGAWTLVSTLPTNGTGTLDNQTGADVAYDPVGNAVYIIPGSGSTALFRWNIGSQTRDDLAIADTLGAPITLGQGACLAFSETPRALWFIRSLGSGSTRQGYLYRIDDPGSSTTTVTGNDTGVDVGGWNPADNDSTTRQSNAVYGTYLWNNYKMTRYRTAGADCLFILGNDSNHVYEPSTYTVSNLTSATPTRSGESHTYPWSTALNGHYVRKGDVEWDVGDYVYVTNAETPGYWGLGWRNWIAGIPAYFSRWNVNTGAWQAITQPTGYVGGLVSVATATPPANQYGTGYSLVGTIVSPEIDAPADAVTWGSLDIEAQRPANTGLSVKVQGHNGSAWIDLPGLGNVTSNSKDLSGVSVSTYRKLRLTATLITLDQAAQTPRLESWSVSAGRPGRLYIAGSENVPSLAWLGVRSTTGVDTRVAMSSAASSTPTTMAVAPRRERLVYAITAGYNYVYLPLTGQWGDARAGLTVPYVYYPPMGYPRDAIRLGNTVWTTRALLNGSPGISRINAAAGATWTDYPGTGTADDGHVPGMNSIVVPSSGLIWAPSVTTATSDTVRYYRFNTVTTAWGATPFTLVATDGVTPIYAGQGGCIFYSPQNDSLLIVNKRIWSNAGYVQQGDGRLYRVTGALAKMNAGGTIQASDTGVAVAMASPSAGKSSCELVTTGGKDYIVYYGADPSGATALQVIGDLGQSTPTRVTVPGASGAYAQRNGADMSWYGDGYLYYASAAENNWTPGDPFYRILVPADPLTGTWGAWESLGRMPWGNAGSSAIVAVEATITPGTVQGYQTAVVDSPSLDVGDTKEWGWVSYTAVKPDRTDVGMTVQSWNGATWADVPGFVDVHTNPVDLGTLSASAYPTIRVRASLETSNPFAAPSISNWQVTAGTDTLCATSDEIVPQAGATSWGTAMWEASVTNGATSRLTVRGWSAASGRFIDIPGYVDRGGATVDLSALRVADWPRLKLTGWLEKTSPADPTPQMVWWSVTSIRPVSTISASLTCGNCHDIHDVQTGTGAWDLSRASQPTDPKIRASVSDVTTFCLGCHTGTPARQSASGASAVPWDVYWSRPIAGSTSVVWDKTVAGAEFTSAGHYTSVAGRTDCAVCHDPHGSANPRLTAWTRPAWFTDGVDGVRDNTSTAAYEENLCYQCHGNGTIGKAAPGAQDVASPASRSGAHPISSGSGLHADGEAPARLGVGNRHAECVDCHDPHAARPGVHTAGASQPGPALRGAWGVQPTWGSAGGVPATSYRTVRFVGASTEREAYLCFKCHTSYTSLPDGGTLNGVGGPDLSYDFNPGNQSYHNVLGLDTGVRTSFTFSGVGTVTWPWVGDNSLKNGLTSNSKLTCTDCHSSKAPGEARGPHGSTAKYMLDPDYSGDWEGAMLDWHSPNGTSPSNLICTKCHTFSANTGPGFNNVHSWGGVLGAVHTADTGTHCVECHVRIPHGSKRPRLLGYYSDPAPYAAVAQGNSKPLFAITLKSHNPTDYQTWRGSDCAVGCTGQHEGFSGAVWP